jgi:hypothetical protein
MSSSPANSFITLAGLMLLASLVCGPVFGAGTVIPIYIAMYFMLTATNAISRGEKKARQKKRQ